MLIDSHCHLDFPQLAADETGVLARARAAGVAGMLTIGTRLDQFERVRAIAERHENVWCSVGVHPHEAKEEGQRTPERLIEAALHPKVVGIGETGLDFYYEHSPRAEQAESFRAHIAASRQTGLPLIVHTRDADRETGDMLEEEYAKGAFPGLIHCFSSGPDVARRALALGMSISISGIVTFKAADSLRTIVRDIPLDRLLVETDAPYLAPIPKRGKTNEPAFVAHTAAKVAELKGISVAELEAATTGNFFRLFAKARNASAQAVQTERPACG
ncbi:MAG: TatD family hydrolase [Enhydrobacter sp.]|nr:TatD family hydrolase [Enhydrobacter sp.]